MRGISRESLLAGQEQLEAALASADPTRLAEELFLATDVFAGNAGVRRAMSDPARDGDAKAGFVERLFGGKVSPTALGVVQSLVRARWAHAGDLADALETLAVTAVLAAAERADRLEQVEDELFRFARTIAGDTGLRDAFSSRTEGSDRKAELVRRLLAGKAAPESIRLAVQAAVAPRGMRTEQVLQGYVEAAAARRSQLVAHVISAQPLAVEHRERLAIGLRQLYGRPVRVNVDVDPEVLGGLRVQIGGEVLEGTVSARLDEARRRLAG